MAFPLCVFSSSKDNGYTESDYLNNLILIWLHLQRPCFHVGHIHNYVGLTLQCIFLEDTVQPITTSDQAL